MTITTRPTRAGRVVIESDGVSPYYGSVCQGSIVCRISAPARVAERYTDEDGLDLTRLLRDLRDREFAGLTDVRVLEMREIQ
jgi:hypothetical protein